MSLLVVAGSQRRGSESARVARYVCDLAKTEEAGAYAATTFMDLADFEDSWWRDEGQSETAGQRALRAACAACTGLVVVVPEWNGMVPPILKNFFLLMNGFQLAHKPGYIIAISGGAGGAYPIQELRISSYKNTKVCWIPEHAIVRRVGTLSFGQSLENPERSCDISMRLRQGLATLALYDRALGHHRQALSSLAQQFPYGM
jgi:NAD(P)H-dependent FMN reductase